MSSEREPLLDHSKQQSQSWTLTLRESGLLLRNSLPVISAYSLQMSLQTTSTIIVGRTSPDNLATAAFSYMFAMVTAWLIALGGSTALDTLGSATFTGSSDPHDLGILLQRAFLVLTGLYIPVVVIWIFSYPIFLALGQNEQIAYSSSRFLSCLIPGGLGYIYFESMKKYLQAQGLMRPGTYVLLIIFPVNIGLNVVFVRSIGLLGAPIATSISYWLCFLLLVLYSRWNGYQCWGGWSKKSIHNLWPFLRLALLGYIHVGTEWWAFEIIALVAGRLGKLPLEAQSVIMTADQIINTIPFGLGVATSARVGNLLGARDAIGARRTANTSAWLSIFLGSLILAILLGTRNHFAKIFNDDEDVVRLTADVLPAVALFQIADGINGSCGGSLRGMGRQHIGAAVNIFSYYIGALPLGIYLAFHGWGLSGLWWGNCIALYLAATLEWLIVAWSNWNKQVDNALARIAREEEEEEEERVEEAV